MNFLSLLKTSLQQSSKHYFINLVLFVMIIGDLLQSRPCLFQLPIIFHLFLKFLLECIIQVEATFLLRISMWNVNEDFNCLKHKLFQETKARFRRRTFHEPNLIRIKADPNYLDQLK